MKFIFLITLLINFTYADSYTFLMDDYNEELELESKILSSIAKASLKDEVVIYIPNVSIKDKRVYRKYFTLSKTCNNANFVFVKNSKNIKSLCTNTKQIFFTNNYKRLLEDKRYYGAFFWNKSRPNIVFIKNRLKDKLITLPKNYLQFVEDL